MVDRSPTGHSLGVSIVVPHLDDPQSRPLMAKLAGIFRQIAAMREVRRFRLDLSLPKKAELLHRKALRLYDQYLTYTVTQLQKEGWTLSCAQGCAACCFAMPADVSSWELLMIYAHLQEMGRVERAFRKHLENCQVYSRVAGDTRGLAQQETGTPRELDLDRVLLAYSKARQPCGFLLPSRECLIYSYRPLSCRMHFAFTPAAWCDPSHARFPQGVRLNFRPHRDVCRALEGLDRRLGLPHGNLLCSGLVTVVANVMRFAPLTWL
jgi:Fe-S-cluster containining protein